MLGLHPNGNNMAFVQARLHTSLVSIVLQSVPNSVQGTSETTTKHETEG